MEKIEVSDFLVLKEAGFNVGRINVLFGPQSSGKSILAKLLFFFRGVSDGIYSFSDTENLKSYMEDFASKQFKRHLSSDTWASQSFLIKYMMNNGASITLTKTKKAEDGLKVTFSEDWLVLFKAVEERIKELNSKSIDSELLPFGTPYDLRDFIESKQYNGFSRHRSFFIPAIRSVLANFEKYKYSYMESENFYADPLFSRFGSLFQAVSDGTFSEKDYTRQKGSREIYSILTDLSQSIAKGIFYREKEEQWVKMQHGNVKFENASSGQQESIPMLEVLIKLPFLLKSNPSKRMSFFVEEPEAHLFPESQAQVIKIFSTLYNAKQTDFTLTTHSPYILTALNNHIMAGNVIASKGSKAEDKIKGILGSYSGVVYDDVEAYTIENGILKSVKDNETSLIDGSAIDSASEIIQNQFCDLLNLS